MYVQPASNRIAGSTYIFLFERHPRITDAVLLPFINIFGMRMRFLFWLTFGEKSNYTFYDYKRLHWKSF